jgi:hypothetical protein
MKSMTIQFPQDYLADIPEQLYLLVKEELEKQEEERLFKNVDISYEFEYNVEDYFIGVCIIADEIQTNAKKQGYLICGLEGYLHDCVKQLIKNKNRENFWRRKQ